MKKLLNKSLNQFVFYAGIVLTASIPVYYVAISELWQYELDEHNIILTPEADREDKFLIIGAVTLLTVLFFVLLLGVLVWVNRRVSKKLWKPFYDSLTRIREFDLSKQQRVEFERTDISEFSELNQGLEKLISGNITSFVQQKEFADNASHELQTPLAVIQSKLELLLQSQTLQSEHYGTIEDALKALSRVSRINKNLLLLSKIGNSQFTEIEKMNLSEMIEWDLAIFGNFAENQQLSLNYTIEPDVWLKGNRALVEILVQNLLTNAIRYCSPAGSISLFLDQQHLSVRNSGSTSLKTEQLFKRFASASNDTPGTGLGLALVKQICIRSRWHVEYEYQGGFHVFSVHF